MNQDTLMEREGFKNCMVCKNVFYSKQIEQVICDDPSCKKIYKNIYGRIYGRIYYSLLKKFNLKTKKYTNPPKRICYKCKKECYGKLCKECYLEKKGIPLTQIYNQRKKRK